MSIFASKEQVERWRNDPMEFLNYLAQTRGDQVWPPPEIFKHQCRVGDKMHNEITKTNMGTADVDNKLTVVELTFEPRKGWSLLNLFNEHVFENYGVEGDDEIFDASHVHFFVNGNGFPYSTIVDFQYRLPAIKELAGFGDITLVYERPEPLSNMRLSSDVMRALRTLEGGEKWTNKDDSLLSTQCIVDVIQQLHMRVNPPESEQVEIKPGIYRHYKKGDYCVLGVALNHDTGARSVVYYRCDDVNKQIWMRSPEEFQAEVVWNGAKVKRFVLLGAHAHLPSTERALSRRRINEGDKTQLKVTLSAMMDHIHDTERRRCTSSVDTKEPTEEVIRNGTKEIVPVDEAFIHNWFVLYPDKPVPPFTERAAHVPQMLLNLAERFPEDYDESNR